ncbi:heterokaryon incompatibility protein-domain-containing protein [Leptodontidium sp. 2 PMI_412]|nr:heterokaryon incompatibility protein-domain-containing protein [Leptodontidium sp. 2 PMI_412]
MDLSASDKYEYQTIADSDTIRLILLQPSQEPSAPLQCSVIHTTLSERAHDIIEGYVALSYVWGNPMDRTSISIDGKHLDITTSLDNAFKHVRDKRRVLQIWADGICVDQTSVFDRNSQVARMGPIYSTARHTIIFLGKDSNENGSFIAFLSSRKTRLSISGSIDDLLRDFLDGPWFGRVWVLQELVLNVDRWVQIGRHRMRWDDVYQYITKGDSPRKLYQPRTAQEERFVAMNALRKDHTSSAGDNAYGPSRLLEVLSKRRGCGATNPRDMVFAHLGIAEKWACSNIPVEYGRTIEEVYEGVIKSFFKRTGNLCFLAQFENINPRRTGFPSWVPDWTVPFYHRMPLGDPKSDSQRDISVVIDTPGILAVKGFLCGKVVALIKSTSLPVVGYMGIEPSYADIVQWMNKSGSREILRTLVNLHATSYQMVKKISNSKQMCSLPS